MANFATVLYKIQDGAACFAAASQLLEDAASTYPADFAQILTAIDTDPLLDSAGAAAAAGLELDRPENYLVVLERIAHQGVALAGQLLPTGDPDAFRALRQATTAAGYHLLLATAWAAL